MHFIVLLLTAGCARETSPEPSFEPLFEPVTTELMTMSSPVLADLDGDGVPDIVFGTGKDRVVPADGRFVFSNEPPVPGYVIAVSGRTNEVLWRTPHPGEAFATARFVDVDRDGVPDVIMGGREGALVAYSGRDGAVLWRVEAHRVAETSVPYNFFTPALIRDVTGDGLDDLLVTYGGDDTRPPGAPRDAGYIAVISTADGRVLASHPTPDGAETYATIVVHERNGVEWFLFGTGGETHGGAAYRAPVASLLDASFATRAERLTTPGPAKGVIATPTLVDITGDGEDDVVISTFDGRLIAVHGATGETLWEHTTEGEEAYHGAAVARLTPDGRLGLFVSRGIGAFPRYAGTVHRLHDAADGSALYTYRDPNYPAGAPLAIDLTGDGVDEILFFSMRYPTAHGARVHLLDGDTHALRAYDVATNLNATPLIAQLAEGRRLELIATSWSLESGAPSEWQNLRAQLLRFDLGGRGPAFRAWAGYLGTNHDGRFAPPDLRTER